MLDEVQPVHSPLGASSAERWMNCPGSVALIKTLTLPESDEPDYRTNGVAAHEAAAYCLTNKMDAWELIGSAFAGVAMTVEITDAVQVYLDYMRPLIALAEENGNPVYIEYRISSTKHKDFYGTCDLGMILPGTEHIDQLILDVTDYKHGEGILVEVENNPQIMYYGYGLLQDNPEVDKVRFRIVQPRGFHPDGVVREWEMTAADLLAWGENVLIPAMDRCAIDNDLDAGKHCRFCPAKLVCPLMTSLFGAAMKANPSHLVNLSNEALGRSYQYSQGVKFYLKALEEENFRRLNVGQTVPGTKLVHKKANRVYRDGAEAFFKGELGDKAVTVPELKGPAAMEMVSATAKKLVAEWAYTPTSGLTVATADDPRPEVIVQTTGECFAAGIAALVKDDGLDIPAFLKR